MGGTRTVFIFKSSIINVNLHKCVTCPSWEDTDPLSGGSQDHKHTLCFFFITRLILTKSRASSHRFFIPDPIANDVKYQAAAQPFLVFGLLTTGLAVGNMNSIL